jgi:ribosome-binding factor A
MRAQRKNTNRIEKVNALVQQEVGRILQNYLDSDSGLVTISKVQTSKDMRWAKIWISIMSGDDEKILKHIHHNLYDIQGDLNRTIETKIVPRLQFFLDTSPRYAEHISEVINRLHNEDFKA